MINLRYTTIINSILSSKNFKALRFSIYSLEIEGTINFKMSLLIIEAKK